MIPLGHCNFCSNLQVLDIFTLCFGSFMPSSDEEVQQAAAFRARGRLPVLSWQHPGDSLFSSLRCISIWCLQSAEMKMEACFQKAFGDIAFFLC
jgi:hypothetical protein